MIKNLKHLVYSNSLLLSLYKQYSYIKNRTIYLISPKLAANIAYKHVFKRNINWHNPQDLIEKIFWLEMNTDTSLWTRCSDKYAVRSYLEEKGLGHYLVESLGHWNDANSIDFDQLPNQFVLKTNNASETVLVVKDKNRLNIAKTKKLLNRWLNKPYGYFAAQSHYLRIMPYIIAEKYLIQNEKDARISPNSLIDYKMWCINGKFECVWVAYDRSSSDVKMSIYDKDWMPIPNALASNDHYKYNKDEIKKPICWNEMIELAEKLAAPFPEIRVDLYVIEDKPFFGEMTFTAGYGFFTNHFYQYLGGKMDLPNI